MSDFRPTAAQAAAIETRGSAVLVSAGAGSGKTKVLTERLMSFITDEQSPADLDSFLIITFTRAAAGELRGRIMDELSAALAENPGNRRLRRQSALCQRAQIGTIHSFCAAMLRENSHLAGISPDFKIVDDDRAMAMKYSALERVMESCYDNPETHPGFSLLADTVGAGRDDSRLASLVLNLHEKIQCHARPELWAAKQIELLCSGVQDVADTPWGREILNWAANIAGYWSDELDRCMELMAEDEKLSTAYMPSISESADALRELCRSLNISWDRAKACLPVPFPRFKRLMKPEDPELAEKIKARRDACKKAMASVADALYADSDSLLTEMEKTAPAMTALLQLTLEFDREYAKNKRRAGLVDYSDLEHMTAQLLTDENDCPTELAKQISRRYTEIMVDEYQDVSQVQDTIFRAVSREGKNLFMVGDVKQSIYRFRLADPGIFTGKYLSYADAAEALEGQARKIMLQENFRSRREVLNAANRVFSLCMSRSLGDIDYDEDAALKCGASYPGEAQLPEIMLLELPKAEDDEETPNKTALEAAMVARKIREMVASGVQISDGSSMRPLEYGDIAILLRSANNVGGIYRRELSRQGIPVASGQGGGFFTSVEVSTVMSMLALIDNPHQDIPLIAVLRSPAFGFSADDLSRIRSENKKGDFYSALLLSAEKDEKSRNFILKLEEFRRMAPDMEMAELVWQLLSGMDMLAICSAMSDGQQRRARLMELVDLSERFENTGYRGLHRFVLWLRRMAEKGQEPSLGVESTSAVQIMSVHKSKGLEFPVVFLCDTARRFNKQDSRDTVLVHPELGLGPKFTDVKRRVEYPTLARNAIKLRLERETLSEEMRLLYVALTRAKEQLYITAALKDPQAVVAKAAAAVTEPMPPELLAQAGAPVNWLIYTAIADGGENIKLSFCSGEEDVLSVEENLAKAEADPVLSKDIEKMLSFVYTYSDAEELPSKVTATELKGRAVPDEDAENISPRQRLRFKMPDFGQRDRPLGGAERGIATHLLLQYMDFGRTDDTDSVKAEIERLRALKFLSEREAEAVDAEAVVKLFASPLGKRIKGAEKLSREFKFSLLCDAAEIFGKAEGEKVLMQGVVDCCIEEDGKLVIIDYKTDNVRNSAQLKERTELYSGQIKAYADALGRIYGKEVKESVLYFLSIGEAVSIATKK